MSILKVRRRTFVLAAAAAVVLGAVTNRPLAAQRAPGESLPVRKIELENGLRLLVLPRPGAPTASFVVRYGVGGVNEKPGVTGIAHLLEHLLFKGTSSVGTRGPEAELLLLQEMDSLYDLHLAELARPEPDTSSASGLLENIHILEEEAEQYVISNEFERILSRNGARGLNATTSNEATTYFVELPANRLELWFVLEADRISNPVFREFYRERDVVMEERRQRVDNNPAGLLSQAHLATAFTTHPYGLPVVGHMSDLEKLGRPQVLDYYRRFYGPNNAVVAIVGDVEPDEVEALAVEYFGPISRGEEPPPVLAKEPEQRGERRIGVEYDAEPQLMIGWHVVAALHEDMPALTMLTAVLTGGRTSRLYRRLVLEDRIATQITSSLGPGSRYPQLFQIHGVPRAPHTTEELELVIYQELERLARTAPSQVELERVRARVRAGEVRSLQSNLGLAFQLAESEALRGEWRDAFRMSARLSAVTPEEVRSVVVRYLEASNRTVATLERPAPGPSPGR